MLFHTAGLNVALIETLRGDVGNIVFSIAAGSRSYCPAKANRPSQLAHHSVSSNFVLRRYCLDVACRFRNSCRTEISAAICGLTADASLVPITGPVPAQAPWIKHKIRINIDFFMMRPCSMCHIWEFNVLVPVTNAARPAWLTVRKCELAHIGKKGRMVLFAATTTICCTTTVDI